MVKAVGAASHTEFWPVARGAKPGRLPVDQSSAPTGLRCPFVVRRLSPLKALRAKDYSENPQTLGEHLKKRRRELGLLQREAAEMMGLSTDTVVNWEKDKTKPVAAQFRPAVAFLGYDPTPEPNSRRPLGGQTADPWRQPRPGCEAPRVGPRQPEALPRRHMAPLARSMRPTGSVPPCR